MEWLGLEPGLLSWDARVTDGSFTSCGVALTPLSCHMCPFLVALGKLRDHEGDSPRCGSVSVLPAKHLVGELAVETYCF